MEPEGSLPCSQETDLLLPVLLVIMTTQFIY
jgi:hypothetical protein